MGPAEPVRPVYCALGSTAPGTNKRAAPAKRVALATRVASLPGICRSVGNKNSSEKTGFHHVGQTGLELLTSGDLLALASQSAGITGGLTLSPRLELHWHDLGSFQPQCPRPKRFTHLSLLSSWVNRHMPSCPATFFCIFGKDEISLYCPGWCRTPDLKQSTHLGLPKYQDYRNIGHDSYDNTDHTFLPLQHIVVKFENKE
ncbi:Histone demethylase UTY [Plecturocebus cupreus]